MKDIVELNDKQRDILFEFSELNNKDIFYDLGSGTGKVVIDAYKKRNVKKSIGIEYNKNYYDIAKKRAKDELSQNVVGKNVDFLHGNYSDKKENRYVFDVSDATVVYNSLAPSGKSEFYDSQFEGVSGVKIIKKDLPLVGFKPMNVSRTDENSQFFLMLTPLKNYRIYSKKEWATSVMGKDSEIKDVYDYYKWLWEKNNAEKIPPSIQNELEILVMEFLPKE